MIMAMRAIRTTKSSTIAVGTATFFVATAAVLGLLIDDRPALGGVGWHLRGTFAPDARPAAAALPAPAKPV